MDEEVVEEEREELDVEREEETDEERDEEMVVVEVNKSCLFQQMNSVQNGYTLIDEVLRGV